MRPVPNGPDDNAPTGSNRGLVYDKWGVPLNQKDGAWSLGDDKAKWVGLAVGSINDGARAKRLQRLVTALGGASFELTAVDAVAIGLGIASPVENGFLFDYATGAPYIPGSSLKGMMRAWAVEWEEAASDVVTRILGAERKENAAARTEADGEAGSVIVFDAHPISGRFQADVITPHHKLYHESKTAWPGDWESPVPIPHLSIAAGAVFGFGLAVRPGQCEEDLDTAEAWLRCGLMHLGVGARTSRGYGRFE